MSAQPLAQTLEISIHALREEDDVMLPAFFLGMYEFLSAPSARRATARRSSRPQSTSYFYPRPPRGGRLVLAVGKHHGNAISIHALREEGDPVKVELAGTVHVISIHALREEGDSNNLIMVDRKKLFLSTPSARRATDLSTVAATTINISIHALREEGDKCAFVTRCVSAEFLSTPSARRATIAFVPSCLDRKNFYPRPPRGGRPCPCLHL